MPCSLYVIELRREVLGEVRFAARNPNHRVDKPCVYVGQTARTPEERLEQPVPATRATATHTATASACARS